MSNKNPATKHCLILQVIFRIYFFHFRPWLLSYQILFTSSSSISSIPMSLSFPVTLHMTSWYVVKEILLPTASSQTRLPHFQGFSFPVSFITDCISYTPSQLFPVTETCFSNQNNLLLLLSVAFLIFFLFCNALLESPLKKKSYSIFKAGSIFHKIFFYLFKVSSICFYISLPSLNVCHILLISKLILYPQENCKHY